MTSPSVRSRRAQTWKRTLTNLTGSSQDLRRAAGHNLKVVVFDKKDFEYATYVHMKYPSVPFYLQTGNPYLGNNVRNHTEKLLRRYGELVEMTMGDTRMNDARVLPQLHTLLWSNKQGV